MIYQRTLHSVITATGVGLHSGCRVHLTLKPAPVDQGIVFVRIDLPEQPHIKCHPFLVNDTRLSSTLVDDNRVRVATVEHLMSAFACYGIDNAIVELSAPEIPIMDGSSNSFIYLLDQAGVVDQSAKKKYIKIKQAIEVNEPDEDKWVRLEPYDGYKVKLSICFDHPLFKPEHSQLEVDFAKQSYIGEISRARTFAFMYEVENIRKNGLGLGGNLNNAVVIDDDTVLNEGGLRFQNEFVRHKILDAIGDLYISGHQIIGAFTGFKSGHAINNKLLRKLLNTPEVWEYVTFEDEEQVPSSFHLLYG
ncbi:MAG: UDP-3-O-[3-hydroxymyristoyl] N-acetylglucosamine deacetylase [Pseudomonadota bacterium]|nr:UDP-3-O-[3-hydroxymyristoyl] N-acetylglucosamine deacetylase [Pseudomonadota bacterium]